MLQPDPVLPPTTPLEDAFRGLLLAAAWRVADAAIEQFGGTDAVAERFPFLLDYARDFEEQVDNPVHTPLERLAQVTRWPTIATELWLVVGLVEEDARFGAVFETLDAAAGERRPSLALMQSWWGTQPREGLRPALRTLLELGLLRPCSPGASRTECGYEVEDNCWSAARGEAPARPAPGLRLEEPDSAPALEALVLPDELRERLDELMPMLSAHGGCLVVRGPEHNGRSSLLTALARTEGRPVLFIDWPLPSSPGATGGMPAYPGEAPAWLGAFATLTEARPVIRLRATPGECLRLPVPAGYDGWIGLVCGDEDTVEDLPAPAWTLRLPLPNAAQREALIVMHGGGVARTHAAELASRLHLSAGHLTRALWQERHAERKPDARTDVTAGRLAARVREVALAGGAAELDSLARRLDTRGAERDALIVDAELQRDLDILEARCRQRDRLRDVLPDAFAARLNAGVRALFAGPSGTGKTLAAQTLAARLGLPLYRLDLAAVVSKYIGETERNLHRLLSAAEALDVLLLMDEGDALLARRTEVGNAHDRYANLETNFLLQRLESHRGLVLVTTNALDCIDTAFLRRFDVLLNFRAPEFQERLALWRAHLPSDHAVGDPALEHIAEACELSGGQVRNVALAATSMALALGRVLDDGLLREALRREYRRGGGLYPLGR
ncbi:MAG: ATP-binding protein [Candidatus Competibacteraceae bacterium]